MAVLCRVMRGSRSGFYAWRRRGPDDHRQALLREVRGIHRRKRGSYGSRRMAKELRRCGYEVGRYQARSLMREAGVEARQRRRWRHTTDSQHTLPVAPNLLNRQFMVAAPNRAWVADITAIWTLEGWLYLAAVLDLHDRQLVGWAMADHMRTQLVLDALEMAVGRRQPEKGLIHHSDRGSQGGFNWSSQHLDIGGVAWDDHVAGALLNRRGGHRCVRLADRASISGMPSARSGSALLRDYRDGIQQLPDTLDPRLPDAEGG